MEGWVARLPWAFHSLVSELLHGVEEPQIQERGNRNAIATCDIM
jgi:hypothetical protein